MAAYGGTGKHGSHNKNNIIYIQKPIKQAELIIIIIN